MKSVGLASVWSSSVRSTVTWASTDIVVSADCGWGEPRGLLQGRRPELAEGKVRLSGKGLR